MPEAQLHASSRVEIVIVSAVCFGLFIAGSLSTVAGGWTAQRQLDDQTLISLLFTEAILAALALVILRTRSYPILRLRPTPTWTNTGLGIVLAAAGYLAWVVAYLVVAPSNASDQPISHMIGAGRRSMELVLVVSVANGLYEEMFLLGYMMDALRRSGASIAIGVTCLVRLFYHLYQGPVGALSITVWGLVGGVFYWRTKRLWAVIVAHELMDFVALV
jgi:uncharacterized protein